MEGRWTLHVCKDCGQRAHYQDRCPKDRRRVWTEQVEVPVVPCDDAAVERGMDALEASDKDYRYVSRKDIRATVEAIFAAAASDAEAAILAARNEQTRRAM